MSKQTDKPKPHYTQKSENSEGHSGLPIKSDGSYRDASDLNKKQGQSARG
jgi:hypothetical protein